MTYVDRTQRLRHERIVDVVEIEGIPFAFTTGAVDDSILSDGRTGVDCIVDFSAGERRLNLETLVEEGSSFEMQLGLDPLIEWLMRPRRGPDTFLTSQILSGAVMTGSGTVQVGDTDSFVEYFFIGRETFSYTSSGATSFSGVERAVAGSKPQAHFGDAFAGESAAVFSSVPSWRGRRLTLSSCYVNEDGTATALEPYATYRIQNAPAYVDGGGWAIRAESMINWFAATKCYVGQRSVDPIPNVDNYGESIALEANDLDLFLTGNRKTFALVTVANAEGEAFSMRAIEGETIGAPSTLDFEGPDIIEPPYHRVIDTNTIANIPRWRSAQHVAHLTGRPSEILLTLATSKSGDQTNGDYDTLPGFVRDVFGGDQWRFGAGIDAAAIDVEAFEAVAGPEWAATINEQIDFGDILETFAQDCNAHVFVDATGRLSCRAFTRSLSPSQAQANLDLTDDVILVDGAEDAEVDESTVIHTATVRANWDPLRDQFGLVAQTFDAELAAQFPDSAQAHDVDSLYLSVQGQGYESTGQHIPRPERSSLEAITRSLRRAQRQDALPAQTIRLKCAWPASLASPGEVVLVTNERIPDMTGGSLNASTFLVIGAKASRDHTVDLHLLALQRAWLYPPGAIIVGALSGNTATLSTTTNHGGVDPGLEFAVGWAVTLHRSSSGETFSTTITAIASNTITLAATPSFAPDRVYLGNVTTGASTPNANNLKPLDALVMCGDGGGERTRYS